jgi:hypothetical protein
LHGGRNQLKINSNANYRMLRYEYNSLFWQCSAWELTRRTLCRHFMLLGWTSVLNWLYFSPLPESFYPYYRFKYASAHIGECRAMRYMPTVPNPCYVISRFICSLSPRIIWPLIWAAIMFVRRHFTFCAFCSNILTKYIDLFHDGKVAECLILPVFRYTWLENKTGPKSLEGTSLNLLIPREHIVGITGFLDFIHRLVYSK